MKKFIRYFFLSLGILLINGFSESIVPDTKEINLPVDTNYISWLKQQSLLQKSHNLVKGIAEQHVTWQRAYATPQDNQLVQKASVWFNAYPNAMITKPNQDILQFLGDKALWEAFSKIGIKALHTGPMELSGGIKGHEYTPSADGWFDRIALKVDPIFGTETEYQAMVQEADAHGALIAGDIIPGHTGKGADFLLAELNYEDYPGIYVMVSINKEDWPLLPQVTDVWQSVNLTDYQVDILTKKNYIPGHLQRVLFTASGSKQPVTGWDATAPITGVDGVTRRWVYLHYFKSGQPTMDWLDPTLAAERIISGNIIYDLNNLHNKVLRIDANPFLGIERINNTFRAWSEGHPLSIKASNYIAWLIRKFGGWSFQELNLNLDNIREFSQYGADLSYDFITRPAVEHAILTADASFLRLAMSLEQQYNIKPNSLIHDMQNHDEITYELVHFVSHAKHLFYFDNELITGNDLRNLIVHQMHELAINPTTPYNHLSGNGLCTTFTGLIATRFSITDIYHLTSQQKEDIKKAHLLLAMFNAIQPGVFSISGWDLVGALPLKLDEVKKYYADQDCRWLNRGSYDLMNYSPQASASANELPKAQMVYGSLPAQFNDPNSFVNKLRYMLKIREQYKIAVSKQIALPVPENKEAVLMINELPDNLGIEITALNFGNHPIQEKINLQRLPAFKRNLASEEAKELLTNKVDSTISANNIITIKLNPLEGKVLWIK